MLSLFSTPKSLSYRSKRRWTAFALISYVYPFADYKPPSPPKPKPGKTNDHRYFIYIFEQEGKLDDSAKVNERCRFDIDEYKDKFSLKAVAMNMFKTHSWLPSPQGNKNSKPNIGDWLLA